MRALIADKLSSTVVQGLEALGVAVDNQPQLTADQLPEAVRQAQILVVRSTKVSAAVFEAAPELALVIRAGAGVNTIDVAAASSHGVYVANCPGMNTAAVAELAIGLLIAVDRRIADATLAMRSGHWLKKEFGSAAGLKGRTLGVLGLGSIGLAVAQAAQALGMKIIAWSRSFTPELAEQYDFEYAPSPLDVAAAADAVTVHLALTPETQQFVDASFFAAMKPGAIFINTARGELVDTAALTAAILEKQLRVGLDVFEAEPASDGPLEDVELPRLITCTPHIGASTAQAAEAIAHEVVRIVQVYLASGVPPGTVNLCERSSATHYLVIRHYNRIGVLAGVLNGLRAEGINVEEMQNIIFEGALAACCTLQLDQSPSDNLLQMLRDDENILHVLLQARS